LRSGNYSWIYKILLFCLWTTHWKNILEGCGSIRFEKKYNIITCIVSVPIESYKTEVEMLSCTSQYIRSAISRSKTRSKTCASDARFFSF
jgi:hypothetical protein